MKNLTRIFLFLCFITPALAADTNLVVMNINTLIYHHPTCQWAKKCTKSCIKTPLSKALEMGARPCKVCGHLIPHKF